MPPLPAQYGSAFLLTHVTLPWIELMFTDASGDVVLLHVLDRFMGQIGRAAQVQRYLGIPVIQRHVAELALGHFQRAAGVVDEDVHRAEVLDEIPHHPHCLLPAADVRAVNLCVHAVFAAFRRGLLRTGSVVVVVYADVAAVLREGDCRRRSYAVGCTRNKYVPAHLLQLSFIKLAVPDMLIRRIHCEEQFLRHSAARAALSSARP